jgi:hypothetical protein
LFVFIVSSPRAAEFASGAPAPNAATAALSETYDAPPTLSMTERPQ